MTAAKVPVALVMWGAVTLGAATGLPLGDHPAAAQAPSGGTGAQVTIPEPPPITPPPENQAPVEPLPLPDLPPVTIPPLPDLPSLTTPPVPAAPTVPANPAAPDTDGDQTGVTAEQQPPSSRADGPQGGVNARPAPKHRSDQWDDHPSPTAHAGPRIPSETAAPRANPPVPARSAETVTRPREDVDATSASNRGPTLAAPFDDLSLDFGSPAFLMLLCLMLVTFGSIMRAFRRAIR